MPLYKIDDTLLKPVTATDFRLERDSQRLIEANIEQVFGLKFVDTEFQLNGLRVDTLAFDEETNSFVVIEYKRDRSSSVIDQGYSYLALVLNNKADFVLRFNETQKKSFTKNDIDWSATRVIFVAARFTTHQLGSINFQDLPIELWKVQLYDGGLLNIEQQLADKQAESIKTVTKKSPSTDSVTKEIRTYGVDDLIKEDYPSKSLYEELSTRILDLDSKFVESPQKGYIGYKVANKIIVAIVPQKNRLVLEFNRTQPHDVDDPKGLVEYIPNSLEHKNRHMSRMFVEDSSVINYAMSIVEQVYKHHQ
jgi:predicted transport protein